MKLVSLSFAAALAISGLVFGAEEAKKPTGRAAEKWAAIDPEQAGIQFKLQGEYTGDAGGSKLGCQVIARKEDRFLAVFFPGGLPGDGSDGKKRIEVWGKLDGNKASAQGKGYTATIDGDQITGKTDTGENFTLKKVLRQSPTIGLKAPQGAVILFDGSGADAWKNARMAGNLLMMGPTTKQEFGSFVMHLEFRLPFMPNAEGQGRGNSGMYLQGRYEVQLLDSMGLKGEDNECGGIYRNAAPKVNMCFPPLTWQTYDVDFTAAKFDASGNKTADSVVTIKHNGVTIHDNLKISGPTPGGPKSGGPESTPGPIFLQDHGGDPVYFRNIWIVAK
jgi:hypothetical protein